MKRQESFAMRRLIAAVGLLAWLCVGAAAQPTGTNTVGSSSLVIGTTAVTGGATTQVLFNLGGVVSSDAGFTYAGSSGPVTAAGRLGTSSAGTAANPSLFVGNATTGFSSVSTTGMNISINGVSKADFDISSAGNWSFTGSLVSSTGLRTNGFLQAGPGSPIVSGGSTAYGVTISNAASFGIYAGSGAPSISAGKGSLYLRTDGTTTNDRAYINTNGSTTWTNITTGG